MHRKIKPIAVFITVSLVLQLLFILFFTTFGITLLYPLVLRVYSEKINMTDNYYIEYYNVREQFEDKELFVIGMDENFSESYDVVLDLLKCIKQNVNVTKILIERGDIETEYINACIGSSDKEEFDTAMKSLRRYCDESEDFYKFVENLYNLNKILPPLRKISAVGISLDRSGTAVLKQIDKYFSGNYSALPREIKITAKTGTMEEFIELFYALNHNEYPQLGEIFGKVDTLCRKYEYAVSLDRSGYDSVVSENIMLAVEHYNDIPLFAAVDRSRTKYGSAFYEYLNNQIAKKTNTLMTEIKYSNCTDNSGEKINELMFPMNGSEGVCGVRLINRDDIEWFINYYEFAADTFKMNSDSDKVQRLSRITPNMFFVMSYATPVTYEEKNTEIVE